jgi:hypothetical protein
LEQSASAPITDQTWGIGLFYRAPEKGRRRTKTLAKAQETRNFNRANGLRFFGGNLGRASMESVMFSIQLLLGLLIAAGVMYVVFPPHFKATSRRNVTE